MVDLSGDVWGRIDEDAADGAPEQPVDVWLQQRMSANSTHKARGIEAITCTLCAGTQDVDGAPFIGPFLMDQTWCSYRWSSPITIPVRLLEGVASDHQSGMRYRTLDERVSSHPLRLRQIVEPRLVTTCTPPHCTPRKVPDSSSDRRHVRPGFQKLDLLGKAARVRDIVRIGPRQ